MRRRFLFLCDWLPIERYFLGDFFRAFYENFFYGDSHISFHAKLFYIYNPNYGHFHIFLRFFLSFSPFSQRFQSSLYPSVTSTTSASSIGSQKVNSSSPHILVKTNSSSNYSPKQKQLHVRSLTPSQQAINTQHTTTTQNNIEENQQQQQQQKLNSLATTVVTNTKAQAVYTQPNKNGINTAAHSMKVNLNPDLNNNYEASEQKWINGSFQHINRPGGDQNGHQNGQNGTIDGIQNGIQNGFQNGLPNGHMKGSKKYSKMKEHTSSSSMKSNILPHVSSKSTTPALVISGRLQAIEEAVHEINMNVRELTRKSVTVSDNPSFESFPYAQVGTVF